VVAAFNSASAASEQVMSTGFVPRRCPSGRWVSGDVTFVDVAIAQVISGLTVMGAGHPPTTTPQLSSTAVQLNRSRWPAFSPMSKRA